LKYGGYFIDVDLNASIASVLESPFRSPVLKEFLSAGKGFWNSLIDPFQQGWPEIKNIKKRNQDKKKNSVTDNAIERTELPSIEKII
jgi:hypothetical protein